MAEIVKKATRESFGEALVELGKTTPDIVVLVADLADATKVENFGKAYPDRFIECGIAEGNMVGVAAGLASCGKIPFATSFAMFSAGRVPGQPHGGFSRVAVEPVSYTHSRTHDTGRNVACHFLLY